MNQERKVVWMAALIQFVNMMDYMIVMPLGPDIAREIPVSNADMGIICGCYTLAVAFSGILSAGFLDRFDRRRVALVVVSGLAVATLSTTLATDLAGLVSARVLAGMFGGPCAAIALAMVTDVVPPERRGRALAVVMGAFSISSIAAVPIGLELARFGTWRYPFVGIAALGGLAVLGLLFAAPSMTGHFAGKGRGGGLPEMNVWQGLALGMMGSSMFSAFLIIPNISAYFQMNRGFPREGLGALYCVGGLVSLFMMQAGGRLSDRMGSAPVNIVATVLLVLFTADGFMHENLTPLSLVFVLFMGAACMRNVSATVEAARFASPDRRAGFMSFLASAQHIGSGMGSVASSFLLGTTETGSLTGMPGVALLSIVFTLVQPWVLFTLRSAQKN